MREQRSSKTDQTIAAQPANVVTPEKRRTPVVVTKRTYVRKYRFNKPRVKPTPTVDGIDLTKFGKPELAAFLSIVERLMK